MKQVKDLLKRIKARKRIKKEEYQIDGAIPCVDQSRDFIGGYTDDQDARYGELLPLIIFGDHTRVLKFVNFPFARGADGTQVIYPNDERLSVEFFYFSLDAIDLSNYFYARHFKFLKDQEVLIADQKLIEKFTDFAGDVMEQIRGLRNANKQLSEARDLLLPRLMNGKISV